MTKQVSKATKATKATQFADTQAQEIEQRKADKADKAAQVKADAKQAKQVKADKAAQVKADKAAQVKADKATQELADLPALSVATMGSVDADEYAAYSAQFDAYASAEFTADGRRVGMIETNAAMMQSVRGLLVLLAKGADLATAKPDQFADVAAGALVTNSNVNTVYAKFSKRFRDAYDTLTDAQHADVNAIAGIPADSGLSIGKAGKGSAKTLAITERKGARGSSHTKDPGITGTGAGITGLPAESDKAEARTKAVKIVDRLLTTLNRAKRTAMVVDELAPLLGVIALDFDQLMQGRADEGIPSAGTATG